MYCPATSKNCESTGCTINRCAINEADKIFNVPSTALSQSGEDIRKAIEILKSHNEWRRGNTNTEMANPTELGEAIDIIVNHLSTLPPTANKEEHKMVLNWLYDQDVTFGVKKGEWIDLTGKVLTTEELLQQFKPEEKEGIDKEEETITVEVTDNYYPVQCQTCGWLGSSGNLDGGGQIADTGDYGDCYCPVCGQVDPDECEPKIAISAYKEAYEKMCTIIKGWRKAYDDQYWKHLGEEIERKEKDNTVTEGKEDWIPDFVKKEMAENKTPEKIREWTNDFLSELPEACREKIAIAADSCFPIHVMHEGRKDVEYDTLCQRMNFIQGILAVYKQNLLPPTEPSTMPVVDYEKEAEQLYPYPVSTAGTPAYEVQLVQTKMKRKAHIRARQMDGKTASDIWDAALFWKNAMDYDGNDEMNRPDKATFLSSIPLGGDVSIVSVLLEALKKVGIIENAAFGLSGFNPELLKSDLQSAITQGDQYLTSLDTKK